MLSNVKNVFRNKGRKFVIFYMLNFWEMWYYKFILDVEREDIDD